jgi:hypothetical protein
VIHFADLTGLGGNALAATAACLLLPGVSRLRRGRLAWTLIAVFVAMLIPFQGLPLAAYLRGAIGDLSIPSLLLLAGAVRCALRDRTATGQSVTLSCGEGGEGGRLLPALIVLAALALYPMALGWGSFDPYRLGYGDPWFLSGLLIVALAAAFWEAPEVALVIALAVLAWSAGWYESTNLWDYLLDPLVATYAFGALVKRVILRRS